MGYMADKESASFTGPFDKAGQKPIGWGIKRMGKQKKVSSPLSGERDHRSKKEKYVFEWPILARFLLGGVAL
jgi:hypothetical protein